MSSPTVRIADVTHTSALATNKVLRNTYLLLSATLAFSALTAGLAMAWNLPSPGILITLVVYFGLLFTTHKLQNSAWGILSVFALTGFLGYTLGPIVSAYLRFLPNGHQVVMTALGTTAISFLGLSAYAIKSGRDFSFMGGFLSIGILAAFVLGLVAVFFHLQTLSLVVSGMFVLAMGGFILFETSSILRGEQTNYIIATVSLYVSIYNLFTSLLHLLGYASSDD
ncbi:MAG: Bax inhibitor-1/YccA family protein [Steroidobacteraceae bacterium]